MSRADLVETPAIFFVLIGIITKRIGNGGMKLRCMDYGTRNGTCKH